MLTIWMAAVIALPASVVVWRYSELRCTVGAMLVPGILPAITYVTTWAKHNTWEIPAITADQTVGLPICLILTAAVIATGELGWLYGYNTAPLVQVKAQ